MADPVRFFDGKPPRAIAHRGLAHACAENTLPAFAAALEAGADILETDVHASADGFCVIFHDDDLARVAGVDGPVESLRMDELRALELTGGGGLATLDEALAEFPSARFNIDIKTDAALEPALRAIAAADAASRVLITSFGQRRRRRAVRRLPGAATSASTPGVVLTLIGVWLRLGVLVRLALRNVDAVQVPHRRGALQVVSPAFVGAVQNAGREVHVWTVNDRQEMRELFEMGVDGIITDRCDQLIEVIGTLSENGRTKKIS